jgi:hypothetical protein
VTEPALLTVPGNPDRENEDAVLTGSDRAVVVDGAGIPPEWRAGCHHSVAWYSHSLAAELFARLADHRTPMMDCLAAAIIAVRSQHENSCNLDQGSPSATVASWRQVRDTLQYLVLCDASIILKHSDGHVDEITDKRLEQVTALLIERALEEPSAGSDPQQRLLFARQQAVEATRNQPNGFWCCHTDPAAAEQAIYGELPLDQVHGIIAASDGATRGYQLLDLHSLTEFADQILTPPTNMSSIGDAIRTAETRHAEALHAEATKIHDDLTIAAASFRNREAVLPDH